MMAVAMASGERPSPHWSRAGPKVDAGAVDLVAHVTAGDGHLSAFQITLEGDDLLDIKLAGHRAIYRHL